MRPVRCYGVVVGTPTLRDPVTHITPELPQILISPMSPIRRRPARKLVCDAGITPDILIQIHLLSE